MYPGTRYRGMSRSKSGSGLDSDALAWASAVTAGGGTYSAGTLAAVSTFTARAKAAGYWSKLNRINLFCGNQLAAALVPLKVGGGAATDTAVAFVSGDYSESTGLTGDGTTKYLRTGLIPSVSLTLNDTHLSVYNRGVTAGGGVHIGTRAGGVTFHELLAPFTTGSMIARQYDDVNGRLASAVLTGPFGLMTASRTSSTSHVAYQRATSVTSAATTGGALLATEIYVFQCNNAGAPTVGAYVANPLGGYSIGAGLTQADVTAYNTHIQDFQAALGRSV